MLDDFRVFLLPFSFLSSDPSSFLVCFLVVVLLSSFVLVMYPLIVVLLFVFSIRVCSFVNSPCLFLGSFFPSVSFALAFSLSLFLSFSLASSRLSSA